VDKAAREWLTCLYARSYSPVGIHVVELWCKGPFRLSVCGNRFLTQVNVFCYMFYIFFKIHISERFIFLFLKTVCNQTPCKRLTTAINFYDNYRFSIPGENLSWKHSEIYPEVHKSKTYWPRNKFRNDFRIWETTSVV
jgi:hypothetical protein